MKEITLRDYINMNDHFCWEMFNVADTSAFLKYSLHLKKKGGGEIGLGYIY